MPNILEKRELGAEGSIGALLPQKPEHHVGPAALLELRHGGEVAQGKKR